MKSFREWVLNEEIFPNKTATVFHRTRDPSSIEKMLHYGVEANMGTYGSGLYSTFALDSQFHPYMKRYGRYIVKFKVENLEDFLIIPLSVAKQVLGSEYKISDQFKKRAKRLFGLKDTPREIDDATFGFLPEADRWQSERKYSSDLAMELSKEIPDVIKKFSGVVYRGRQDGYCLLKHEPVSDGLAMLGYSMADVDDQSKYEELSSNKGWETAVVGGSIRHLYGTGQKEIRAGDEVYLSDTSLVAGEELKNILRKGYRVSDFSNRILKVVSVDGRNAKVKMSDIDEHYETIAIEAIFPLNSLIIKGGWRVSPRYKLSGPSPVAP